MRVVIDTNVFVSMLLGGHIGTINDAWKVGKITLIVSDAIISEYQDVLSRPRLHLSADVVAVVMELAHRKAEWVMPNESIRVIVADPSDNKFLEAALEGKADCIVSGDEHLLAVKAFRDIPILTARQFMRRLEESE